MNDEIVKRFLDSPVEARLALSASFKNFIAFFHWYIHRDNFVFKDFHDLIIRKIEDIAFERNERRNLVINIPPRFGKSLIVKYACAWSFMLNPKSNNLYTSYSDDLASDFSKDIREIVESQAFYKFTGLTFKKGKQSADYWVTSAGGGFRAAPLAGALTGYGFGVSGSEFGGFGIIDDANKPSLVKSQTELQNTIDTYTNAFISRANNRARSPILMIMQRVAVDDLTGYVLENETEDWDVVKIPALNEETGEALWEEKFPAKELLKLKNQNPFVYYSQYQQEPIVLGGTVIKTEWFRFYNPKENYLYQFTFITSDTAQKKKEANDYTVFCFWGKTFDNRLHLLDMVRGKWEADELRQQVLLCWEKWKSFKTSPYGFYIEDKSSGIGVIQEITKHYPLPVLPISRTRYQSDLGERTFADKLSRTMTSAPYLANGWVYLPNDEKDDISGQVLSECAAFRADLGHKHDDIVDNLNDGISIAFGSTGISSIFI